MRTLLFLTLMVGALSAQEGRVCNERTIKGSYGYVFMGSMPSSAAPGATIVEGRGAGVRTFDGEGKFGGSRSSRS